MAVVIFTQPQWQPTQPWGSRFKRVFGSDWLPLVSHTGSNDADFYRDVSASLGSRAHVVHRTGGRVLTVDQTRSIAVGQYTSESSQILGIGSIDTLATELIDVFIVNPARDQIGGAICVVVDTVSGYCQSHPGHFAMELFTDMRIAPWLDDESIWDVGR